MTRCVPSAALIYFEQRNGYELLTNISTSPLGKKIKSIDFAEVAKEIGVSEDTVATIKNFTIAVKSDQDGHLVKALYGARFALAVLPPLNNFPPILDKAEFLLENLVIIAEPQQPAKALQLLASTFQGLTGDPVSTGYQYGRHRILRIVLDKQTFSLVTLEGFFLISQNERQLRRCIDTFDGEEPSFSGNAEYLVLKNSFSAPDSLLTLQFKNIADYLPALSADFDFSELPLFNMKTPFFAEIKAMSFGARRHESTIMKKLIVHYGPGQNVSDFLRDHLEIRATKPSRLSLITPNPMFYMWSNSFNLNHFLSTNGGVVKDEPSDTDLVTRLEVITGKNFAEHLTMFGNEITVIAEPGSNSSPLPVPLAMIFIPVNNKEGLKARLKERQDTYNIPMTSGEYGPAQYVYWSQTPQDGLCPLYGFYEELFFLGNSQTLMKKIIDTNGHGFSLLDIDAVKKIDPGLSEDNNTVIYSNNTEVIEIIKTTLKILATLVALEDRQIAVKAQVIINEVLTPLLDGAKMYESSVTRSYSTQETIVVDIVTNISNSL